MTDSAATVEPAITVRPNGPYLVSGSPPIHRRRQVTSEHDEPMTWQTTVELESKPVVALCRCGGSSTKPFCDGTHATNGFDGTEAAPTTDYHDRAKPYPGTHVVVHDDRSICSHAGFCVNRVTDVWKMTRLTDDTIVRAQMMAMIERCPSGALTYRLSEDDDDVEPDLAVAIGVVDDGPLFVTGGIPVQRADAEPFETRRRVTLCRCGASSIKPLCDGSHAESGFADS